MSPYITAISEREVPFFCYEPFVRIAWFFSCIGSLSVHESAVRFENVYEHLPNNSPLFPKKEQKEVIKPLKVSLPQAGT